MPSNSYPYRRFPTIQAAPTARAVRGTDAVKQELHTLCGEDRLVVTVECYPGVDQAEVLALFPRAALVLHADELAIPPGGCRISTPPMLCALPGKRLPP